MSLYNFSNLSTATSIIDIINYVNYSTDYMLGIAIFIATATIIFLTLKMNYPVNISFAVSSYATGVIAILFRIIGLIPDRAMLVSLVCFFIGTAVLYLSSR